MAPKKLINSIKYEVSLITIFAFLVVLISKRAADLPLNYLGTVELRVLDSNASFFVVLLINMSE